MVKCFRDTRGWNKYLYTSYKCNTLCALHLSWLLTHDCVSVSWSELCHMRASTQVVFKWIYLTWTSKHSAVICHMTDCKVCYWFRLICVICEADQHLLIHCFLSSGESLASVDCRRLLLLLILIILLFWTNSVKLF